MVPWLVDRDATGQQRRVRAAVDRGKKLSELSETSGGKAFFTSKAEELPAIYEQIERELRSRYLVAYSSNQAGSKPGIFREVEVRTKRGLKARTARGYYQ